MLHGLNAHKGSFGFLDLFRQRNERDRECEYLLSILRESFECQAVSLEILLYLDPALHFSSSSVPK